MEESKQDPQNEGENDVNLEQNEEESKTEQPTAPKSFGLKAPPKNTQHVLGNIRSLNKKLGQDDKQENQEGDQLMDILLGIDFGNNQPQNNDATPTIS